MDMRGTVTTAIAQLKNGDEDAAREIWNRYFDRVVCLAQQLLANCTKTASDEEDVALSVFKSLCVGAANGRMTTVDDRMDLWLILFGMTKRKTVDLYRYETQQKRDFRKVQHESFLHNDSRFAEGFLQRFVGEEPTPEFLVSANESFLRLISILNDEVLENIAIKKMEGFTNAELASIHGVKLRTIERRLATIRQKWILELPGE